MTDLTRGRCGEPLNGFTEVTEKCELLAGHAGWHRGQYGTEWTAAAQGADDLTPETLAEWRKDAVNHFRPFADDPCKRILALLDALADEQRKFENEREAYRSACVRADDEKAAREEAEQRTRDTEDDYARYKAASVDLHKRQKARVDKAERERDEARTALREARERWGRIEASIRGDDLAAAFLAAEARVAALEAGINALADEWERTYVGFVRHDLAPALRALIEKGD